MNETVGETKNTNSDQKASNDAAPNTVANHQNPNAHPVGDKTFGTGANVK